MSTPSLNLCVVLSDAKRIIKTNRGHFLALGLLFVLPLTFSTTVYPCFSQSSSIISIYNRLLSSSSSTPVPEGEIYPADEYDVNFTALYSLFVLLFSLFTAASITHSTWNGFFGRPLKITSSVKSILVSFFPLAATYVIYQLILGLILVAVGGLAALLYGGIVLFLGSQTDNGNVYFMGYIVLMTVLLVVVMIYIQVEWFLASVVVVVESNWGFDPLRRSSYLLKGMKWIAFSILIYFALSIGALSGFYSSLVPSLISSGWISWRFGLPTALFTVFATALMLYSVATATVLFIYCKALCGELALEMVDGFAPLYVGLPFDGDEKAPKVVYVV